MRIWPISCSQRFSCRAGAGTDDPGGPKGAPLGAEQTYTNPLYDGYLADPFVLKYNGEYYAYGTVPIGRCAIPVLHSTDLIEWRRVGNALEPFAREFDCFWAPEVAYDNGTFFMFYSAGGREGEGHQIRVATAEHPTGPFRDEETILAPDDPFSIDAHPFRDEDGQWYLFYCHDFLEGERPGTGIVVDRLLDMRSLAGERRVVVRAHADWNLFQRQRHWYNRVWDWYTIEGAFVTKHADRYYCFYSGGAWKEPNYGIGCVVADQPAGPYRIESSRSFPEVLRTVPGRVVGPGHCAVALAPDNLHPYLIYHAWDVKHTARLMRMDALVWTAAGPVCKGPTTSPQPAPPLPFFRDLFGGPSLDEHSWRVQGGAWRTEGSQAIQEDHEAQQAALLFTGMPPRTAYLLEVNLRRLGTSAASETYGLYVCYEDPDNFVELSLANEPPELIWRCVVHGDEVERRVLGLPAQGSRFQPRSYHQLLVRRQGGQASVWVDRVLAGANLPVLATANHVGLFTRNASAAFAGVSLTLLDPD